jgi:hypothetical protein
MSDDATAQRDIAAAWERGHRAGQCAYTEAYTLQRSEPAWKGQRPPAAAPPAAAVEAAAAAGHDVRSAERLLAAVAGAWVAGFVAGWRTQWFFESEHAACDDTTE